MMTNGIVYTYIIYNRGVKLLCLACMLDDCYIAMPAALLLAAPVRLASTDKLFGWLVYRW
nr:MAG TPA: hypothetical protein [Caudoviricetes sp.]